MNIITEDYTNVIFYRRNNGFRIQRIYKKNKKRYDIRT